MSFARQFQQGAQAAQGLIDTYDTARKKRDIGRIMDAAPEEAYGFNQQDVAQVQAAADSGQYDIGFDDARKGYTVTAKSDPTATGFVGQAPMKRFLGQDYLGEMTPARIDAGRMGAIADLEMKNDPARGLQMRREMRSQEREDQRFGWEEAAQPLKQEAAQLGLNAARRTERHGARDDSVDDMLISATKEYTGAPEQIGETAKYLNQNSQRISMGGADKNGFVRLSVVKENGEAEFLKLTKQDQATLYAAGKVMELHPLKALEMMAGVNKNLAAAVALENGLTGQLAGNANDVAGKAGNLEVARGHLGVAQQNAASQEAYRREMAAASGLRAANSGGRGGAGGAGGGGKPIKMDVQTTDPVTGKSVKVQVLMNPATGEAVTADGRPFKDSAALDRAMGRMNEEQQMSAAENQELGMVAAMAKAGQLPPGPGQSPMDAYEAAQNQVRLKFQKQRAASAFSGMDEAEQTRTVLGMAQASGKSAPEIAALVGASPQFVQQALDSVKPKKAAGLIGPKSAPPAAGPDTSREAQLKAAHRAWMDAKPGFLQGPTPTSKQREDAARIKYETLLRNRFDK